MSLYALQDEYGQEHQQAEQHCPMCGAVKTSQGVDHHASARSADEVAMRMLQLVLNNPINAFILAFAVCDPSANGTEIRRRVLDNFKTSMGRAAINHLRARIAEQLPQLAAYLLPKAGKHFVLRK